MHGYYCKKCKRDSASPVCQFCGVQITSLNQNERYFWKMLRIPLGDTVTVISALRTLFVLLVLLVLTLFTGELLFSRDKSSAVYLLTMSGILPWTLIFLAIGAAAIFLVLGLQGREEMHFVIDDRGARVMTWIEPSRLKCFARFIAYDEYKITADSEGNPRMLVGESCILWDDVCRFEVRKRAGRIDLYRPSGFRFMSLYPEKQEMEELVQYITPRMKHLVKK